jgi:azurin
MKRAMLTVLSAAALAVPTHLSAQAAAPAGAQVRTIDIEGTDTMKFSVTQITAKPGERIHVRLKIVSAMPPAAMSHNFVLLKEGVNAQTFATEAMMAATTAYIPAARKGDVLAATPLGSGGKTVEVTFTAPTKAGTYTYLCTFPGHFAAGMKGTLVVK